MTIRITGDFAALERFKRKLETMDRAIDDAITHMARQGAVLTAKAFGQRRSPYGERWPATQQPNPILEKSGRLRRGIKVARRGRAITWTSAQPYSKYHQSGTKFLPPRVHMPDKRGLPRAWVVMFRRTMKERFRAHFR